jgi:prophage antirepressor-like protein
MELALNEKPAKIYCFDDKPDAPWFQAKPILTFLEYSNITTTLDKVPEKNKSSLQELVKSKGAPIEVVRDSLTTLGYHEGKAICINESGLYQLIFGSKKPEAVIFTDWVTEDQFGSAESTTPTTFKEVLIEQNEQFQLALTTQTDTFQEQFQLALTAQKDAFQEQFQIALTAQKDTFQQQFQIALTAQKDTLQQHVQLALTTHKDQLQLALTTQRDTLQEQFQLALTTQKNELREQLDKIPTRIVFSLSQRLKDVRDGIAKSIASPSGALVDALRKAVKRPAKKSNPDSTNFPESQRATTEEISVLSVGLATTLRELLDAPQMTGLGIAIPGVKLTYAAWKRCRAMIGVRCKKLRCRDPTCARPLLWAYVGPTGASDAHGGARYIYMKDEARRYLTAVLRQDAPKVQGRTRETTMAYVTHLVQTCNAAEEWPLHASEIEPSWPRNGKMDENL